MSLINAAFMVFNLLWLLSCSQTKWATHITSLRLKQEGTFEDLLPYLPLALHRASFCNFEIKAQLLRSLTDRLWTVTVTEADTAVQGAVIYVQQQSRAASPPLHHLQSESCHLQGLSEDTTSVGRVGREGGCVQGRGRRFCSVLWGELL